MLGRILSLVAALALSCASAHAYVPERSIAAPEMRASAAKTASGIFAAPAEQAAKEKSTASACRVWEIWFPPQKLASSIGYTGYYADAESGDYYAQQRYYRAEIGRFTRVDPWAGDPNNPITLNKYLYANGNPLTYTDPDGRCGVTGLAVGGTWMGAICDAIDSRMIGTSDPAAIKEYRQGVGVGMVRTTVDGVVGTARTVADFHLAAYERLLGFDVGANDRLGATVAGGVEAASSPRLTTTDYIERNVNAFNEAKDSGNFAAAGEVTGSASVDLNSVATGTAGLARGTVGLARLANQRGKSVTVAENPNGPGASNLAETLVTWVDEGGDLRGGGTPGMRPDAYRYQSSAPGARSGVDSGRSQAPYLEFKDASGQVVGAKFDGVSGTELIDRKLNPVFSAKAIDQARRQAAVAQHHGLQAVWELPSQRAVDAANRFMTANKLEGITVRLKEP